MTPEFELSGVRERGGEAPKLDDGWWASVLADEDAYLAENEEHFVIEDTAHPPQKREEKTSNEDWEKIKAIYDRDDIVVLKVHACNRGGLLVHGLSLRTLRVFPFSATAGAATRAVPRETRV